MSEKVVQVHAVNSTLGLSREKKLAGAYIEQMLSDDLEVGLQSFHEGITDLDKAMLSKVIGDRDLLLTKAKALMQEYLDLSKPCFNGGPVPYRIEVSGASETVYRVTLEFTFENESDVYWTVVFNVPLMSPPLENVQKSAYWPIEMAWRVQ